MLWVAVHKDEDGAMVRLVERQPFDLVENMWIPYTKRVKSEQEIIRRSENSNIARIKLIQADM